MTNKQNNSKLTTISLQVAQPKLADNLLPSSCRIIGGSHDLAALPPPFDGIIDGPSPCVLAVVPFP